MARTLVVLLGVLAALFPNGMIDVFEGLAVENAGECTRTQWIGTAIRAEGLVITVASLIGGRPYARLMDLAGLFGVVVLLSPRLYREVAGALLYEEPDAVEWDDRLDGRVRLIGALYVFLAIGAFGRRRGAD
jgi:hypothetical protein